MKLTIDTSEKLDAEQLYGLYVAAKKKEKIIEPESKSYKKGFDAGYAKCHRDYHLNQCVVFESGKEEGYKEGYEKAKVEEQNRINSDIKMSNAAIESALMPLEKFMHDFEKSKLEMMLDDNIKQMNVLLERAKNEGYKPECYRSILNYLKGL